MRDSILGLTSLRAACVGVDGNVEVSGKMCIEMVDRITELESEASALKESGRWTPVSERLSPRLERVLCVGKYSKKSFVATCQKNGSYSVSGAHVNVTHWTHLPSPPVENDTYDE